MSAAAVLRPRARRDLDDIWDFTAKTWGRSQAEVYLRRIAETVADLAAGPLIGRPCHDIRAGYRKFPVGSHVIFYRLAGDGIEIVRILHQRMDVGSL